MENNKEIGILYFNTRDELIRVDLKTVGSSKPTATTPTSIS